MICVCLCFSDCNLIRFKIQFNILSNNNRMLSPPLPLTPSIRPLTITTAIPFHLFISLFVFHRLSIHCLFYIIHMHFWSNINIWKSKFNDYLICSPLQVCMIHVPLYIYYGFYCIWFTFYSLENCNEILIGILIISHFQGSKHWVAWYYGMTNIIL